MKTLFRFILCLNFLLYGLEAFSSFDFEYCHTSESAVHEICNGNHGSSQDLGGHSHGSCDHSCGSHSHQFLNDASFRPFVGEISIATLDSQFLYQDPYLNKLVRPPSA